MTGRDVAEEHRASTPLELLFDLTFVVAVSQAAAQLSESLDAPHPAKAIGGYLMVFFAIWWAWMNFTWFASAYDTDDIGYRLLTLLQMSGVLVLAAGVPSAFAGDYTAVTVGYVIMRTALVGQWIRVAFADSARRPTAVRYAVGITVVQLGWVGRLALPPTLGVVSFLALSATELVIPVVAERPGRTPWHPHHIAERYGLFTLIVLGECVLASTVALQPENSPAGWNFQQGLLGIGALALLFSLWWLYFLLPAAARLQEEPNLAWLWGYSHYAIFAALAALGAGLEAAARVLAAHPTSSETRLAFAVALPVVVFVLALGTLHAPGRADLLRDRAYLGATCLALLGFAGATSVGLPVAWCVVLCCIPVAAWTARTSWRPDNARVGQHSIPHDAASSGA